MSELALFTTQRNQISIFIGQSLKKAMVSNFVAYSFVQKLNIGYYISCYLINETTH
jgi:hypothetical protein